MTRGRFENVVDEAGPEFARYPAEGRNPLRGDRELLDYLLRLPPRGFEGRHHEVATGVAFLRSGSAHDLRLVNKPSAVSHPGHTDSRRDNLALMSVNRRRPTVDGLDVLVRRVPTRRRRSWLFRPGVPRSWTHQRHPR